METFIDPNGRELLLYVGQRTYGSNAFTFSARVVSRMPVRTPWFSSGLYPANEYPVARPLVLLISFGRGYPTRFIYKRMQLIELVGDVVLKPVFDKCKSEVEYR